MKRVKFALFITLLLSSIWATGSAVAAISPESSVVNNSYGGSAFAPADRYSANVDYAYVTEKGAYTMVFWITDNADGTHSLNLSEAQNNKWLFKAKKIYSFDKDFTNIAYSHNYIFYRDGEGVSALVLSMDKGVIARELELVPGSAKGSRGNYVFKTVQTKDKGGILYRESSSETYRIFLENELSHPITFADPEYSMSSALAREPSVVLASARDRLIFVDSGSTSVFNIKEQKLVKLQSADDPDSSGYFEESNGIQFYAAGKFYVWSSGADKYEYFKIYDENFKYISTQRFKLNQPRYIYSHNITMSQSTLHVWDINYDEPNTLKLESFLLDGK